MLSASQNMASDPMKPDALHAHSYCMYDQGTQWSKTYNFSIHKINANVQKHKIVFTKMFIGRGIARNVCLGGLKRTRHFTATGMGYPLPVLSKVDDFVTL